MVHYVPFHDPLSSAPSSGQTHALCRYTGCPIFNPHFITVLFHISSSLIYVYITKYTQIDRQNKQYTGWLTTDDLKLFSYIQAVHTKHFFKCNTLYINSIMEWQTHITMNFFRSFYTLRASFTRKWLKIGNMEFL